VYTYTHAHTHTHTHKHTHTLEIIVTLGSGATLPSHIRCSRHLNDRKVKHVLVEGSLVYVMKRHSPRRLNMSKGEGNTRNPSRGSPEYPTLG
jgi:hypothetical protein